MSPLMSWLLLIAMAVVGVGIASLVRLLILALSDTEPVRRLNGWADIDHTDLLPQTRMWEGDR